MEHSLLHRFEQLGIPLLQKKVPNNILGVQIWKRKLDLAGVWMHC